MKGTLYIVATPVGNLGDITLRALEVLKSVDFVLCEDTRVTKKLLTHYEISTATKSFHHHSTPKVYHEILELLQDGKQIALVSDAGTPGISDPGNNLVDFLSRRDKEIIIVPIPGASALLAALSVSGFPTDSFLFLGFPPHKKGRKKYFEAVSKAEYTVAFFESSHRIQKAILELAEFLPKGKTILIGRELTKKFETLYRGAIDEISSMNITDKGEFVVVINGKP